MTKKTSAKAAAKKCVTKRFTNRERHGILQVGKDIIKHKAKKKAPEVTVPRLSFWVGLCLCIIPVQPLADIVSNDTRQYGDYKRHHKFLHKAHLLSTGGNTAITLKPFRALQTTLKQEQINAASRLQLVTNYNS